jgi:hypothetical protein
MLPDSIRIRAAQGTDFEFIRNGPRETNWEDFPQAQKSLLTRTESGNQTIEDLNKTLRENPKLILCCGAY